MFLFLSFYVACNSTSSANGHHQASDMLTVILMLGPTYLYGVIYSALSLEATFLVVSSILRLFMRMLMASFLSIPSLPIKKLYVFCPLPPPWLFCGDGAPVHRLIIFIHATISEITKRVCEQAEPRNTRHVNSFNKSTASCLVLKFVSFFATDTFYSSLLTYVIDR